MHPPITRPMVASDLDAGRALFRQAFGSFLRIPERLMDDSDFVGPRFLHTESLGHALEVDGQLQAFCLWSRRGSMAVLGPIVVRPNAWSKGTGRAVVEASLAEVRRAWNPSLSALFTFPNSPLHLHFFQRHGFLPGHLVASMVRAVRAEAPSAAGDTVRLSEVAAPERAPLLAGLSRLTGGIHPGLDVTREATGILEGGLGEVILLTEGSRIEAAALCHVGPRTEAGSGVAAIRFGAVAPGPGAEGRLGALLDSCDQFARERGAGKLKVSVNTGCRAAYGALLGCGLRVEMLGVWMQDPDAAGYHGADAWVFDDAR